MAKKVAWPKVVPILEPSEIHKGSARASYPSGRPNYKKLCILAWGWKVFHGPKYHEASKRYGAVLDSEFKKLGAGMIGIALWNDHPCTTKEEIAALWKRVMRRLGYTVPCERE